MSDNVCEFLLFAALPVFVIARAVCVLVACVLLHFGGSACTPFGLCVLESTWDLLDWEIVWCLTMCVDGTFSLR